MGKVIYIVGVSGCGKTTIGKALSGLLHIPFFDADDYHSKENIEKMKAGNALNDKDRMMWLKSLNTLAKKESKNKGAIIACSGLKEKYRIQLSNGIEDLVNWVYLKGNYKMIYQRMSKRNHFMPPTLLKSQFDILEEPNNAITISIDQSIENMLQRITKKLAVHDI